MTVDTQKCAIYARVSTEDQTTENQVRELMAWADRRGWKVIRVYRENESAWKSGHQKEWAQLRADARMREFHVVLVWALDRVTREGISVLFQQIHTLKTSGVQLISMQESWIESIGELSEVFIALVGFIGNYESKRRSERTLAGMARVRAEGVHVGRPRGRKDSVKRLRSGQVLRREREQIKRKRGAMV